MRAFSEDLSVVALERWERDAAAVAGSLFGLARLFIMLRFHPRLSLVTDVLTASAVHLVHFFIMFFMVVAVYRCVFCGMISRHHTQHCALPWMRNDPLPFSWPQSMLLFSCVFSRT